MFPLFFGISMSDLRPGLPETKPELPEEPLTLTHSKCALKAILFKPTHPISYRSRGVFKESCNLSAAQAPSHKKNSVQSVAVTRFVRAPDFILKGEHHLFRIGDLGFSHGGTNIPP